MANIQRTNRDPNPDFGSALADDVGQDAEETDGGENQRERCERKKQRGIEARVERGFSDELVHGEDVGNGQLGVELPNDLLEGKASEVTSCED